VQNADFLLVLGCRLNIRQISYGEFAFAPRAWKAHVDVDPAELYKPTLDADMRIQADLRRFMPILRETLADWNALPEHAAYLTWCRERVRRYPVLLPRHASSKKVNPYFFMDRLFNLLEEDDAVVTANGSACVVSFQAAYIKRYTRLYCNSGCASMGYDLPAAIGAAVSGNAKRIICLAGDGSIMMNIQELQTIIGKKLPIIIFLLNNNGYLSIQQTQEAYFSDNILGTSPRNGLSLPDFTCLAEAFCFTTSRITEHCGMEEILKGILSGCPPHFCEVILDQEQGFEPKLNSRKLPDGTMLSPALEDMSPFLPEYELRENHI
jgi:acetolactate synthase-1/2/3 large subunit